MGRLIGKGGETIKAMTRDTGARIDVSKDDGELERTVVLSGSAEALEKALAAIDEIIKTAEGQSIAQQSNGRSRSRSRGDGRAPVERRVLQVPQEYVGMIIGKGGETVKALQKDTGAKIEVARFDAELERTVTLSGSLEAVEKAVRMIMDIVNRARDMFDNLSSDEDAVQTPKPPPGFEESAHEGFLHHPGMNIFFQKATGRLCWFDASCNMYRDLHQGGAFALTFGGHASMRLSCNAKGGTSTSTSSSSSAKVAKKPAAKHVVIPDLHRVGQVLKLSLDHLDRPSAMLGVFGAAEDGAGVPVEIAARGLHEKLIHRLAASRSEWPDDTFFGALTGALMDIAAGYGGAQPVAAVAMTTGRRIIAVATPGARLCVITGATASSAVPSSSFNAGGATTCFEEVSEDDSSATAYVALTVGESCLDDAAMVSATAPQLYQGRLRAASLALIQTAAKKGASGPVAAAVARLGPSAVQGIVQGTAPPAAAQPANALAGSAVSAVARKVRVHQILIRYWSGKGSKPTDPVRRRPVSRSADEAEMQILDVLQKLTADGCATFSTICKKVSECQSALKGGDLSGDLGWLDQAKDAALKQAKGEPGSVKSAVKSDVPTSVLKAAFELEVGELSDIVSSESGLHLILRTA